MARNSKELGDVGSQDRGLPGGGKLCPELVRTPFSGSAEQACLILNRRQMNQHLNR